VRPLQKALAALAVLQSGAEPGDEIAMVDDLAEIIGLAGIVLHVLRELHTRQNRYDPRLPLLAVTFTSHFSIHSV
jgi:hypothetical protein